MKNRIPIIQALQPTQERKPLPVLALLLLSMIFVLNTKAQSNMLLVDMSAIDGIEINQYNLFNYKIENKSSQSQQVQVKGIVHYKRSPLNFSYQYNITLQPGVNIINKDLISSPTWTFSDNALRELFFDHNKLPQGTYEYCISLIPKASPVETSPINTIDACVYQTVNDIFLINLIDPENNAKIYEYHPMLSWVANYPFASELSYKIRVAELKEGQNPQNAITRNNPVYQDNNVMSTSTVYPVTAKPLVLWQPYVWTVDAYYKGILLGGAEVWKFTIVEDSLLKPLPVNQSYYEFEKHHGETILEAKGELKLKYITELKTDTLNLQLMDSHDQEIKIPQKQIPLVPGDNRIVFEIMEKINLKHNSHYNLIIKTSDNKTYTVPFKYSNPLYIKQ